VWAIWHYLNSIATTDDITFEIAEGFFDPQSLLSGAKIFRVYQTVKAVEKILMKKWQEAKVGTKSIAWVQKDCSKRLGELAVLAMQKDQGSSEASKLWRELISRDPSMLQMLLLKKG